MAEQIKILWRRLECISEDIKVLWIALMFSMNLAKPSLGAPDYSLQM